MDIIGWAGKVGSNRMTSHSLDVVLRDLRNKRGLDRVIVALTDRRSMMPVKELLELRLDGVRVEDGTSLIEKVSVKSRSMNCTPVDNFRGWLPAGSHALVCPAHRIRGAGSHAFRLSLCLSFRSSLC